MNLNDCRDASISEPICEPVQPLRRDHRPQRGRSRSYDVNDDDYNSPDAHRVRSRCRSFPILKHGPKEAFNHLTPFEWIQFQCLCFWTYSPNHKFNVKIKQ